MMSIKNWLSDIRFWIVFFFAVRLVGITNAPLEGAHNWRQALTNMIARNYYESHTRFFYPMVDMGGERTGIIGSEFPFFNWLIAIVSSPFGFEHWYGRLINLIVSSFGMYFFYKLVRAVFSEKIAFHATIVLVLSIWFSFSRKIMPDTFSVSFVIIGLYFGYQYLIHSKKWSLLIAFLCVTLGVLSKIPSISLLAFIPILVLIKSLPTRRVVLVIASTVLSTSIVFLWYFYWVPKLIEHYKFELYFPKTLKEGFLEVSQHIPELLEKFYFSAFFSYVAFLALIFGLFFFAKKANFHVRLALTFIVGIFVLFIFKTGAVFPTHSYYIIPLVPILAIIVAHFTTQLSSKWGYVFLVIIGVESIANQQHDFFIRPQANYKLQSEFLATEFIPKNTKVILNGGPSPQSLYFFNRKGWSLSNEELEKEGVIDSIGRLGATHFIVDKTNYTDFVFRGEQLHEDDYFAIYFLTKDK